MAATTTTPGGPVTTIPNWPTDPGHSHRDWTKPWGLDTKNFISPDVDGHSRGVWKMARTVDGFGPHERLGTYDFLLQRFAK
jgi:hypothetical protein